MDKRVRDWFYALLSAFTVFSLSACAWTGTGTVMDRGFVEGHWEAKSAPSTGRSWVPECFELTILDDKSSQEIKECFSERVWNDAMLGHQITITKEYR